MFVIDASVTMAWCFEDEASAETDAVLARLAEDGAVVPAIWPPEIANVLLVAERRGRLTEAQSSRFLGLVSQLPIEIENDRTDMTALGAAGRRHALSAYDASYLILAARLGCALATVDVPLADAARRTGVELLITAPTDVE